MLPLVLESQNWNPTYIARNCSTDSFYSIDFIQPTWKAARAELVARWQRIIFTRRYLSLRRFRVKAFPRHRNQFPQPLPHGVNRDIITESIKSSVTATFKNSEVEDVLLAEDNFGLGSATPVQPHAKGLVPCSEVFDVSEETPNSTQEGFAAGTPSKRPSRDHTLVDPMENMRRESAAPRSSHCCRNEKENNGLTPEQFLENKKAEGVALVMAVFNKWLDKKLAVITYAYETASASGSPATGGGGAGSQNSDGNGESERSSRRPKRQLDRGDPNNSSSGGDENGRDKGGNKRAKKDSEAGRKFACPYYKHDPRTHRKERTCCGPGWDTIHRLKEHLYRKHRLPKHACVRCGESFGGLPDLNAHLRADARCEKVDMGPVDGIDEEMESKLKVRKAQTGLTDEQKWREIYLILFPKANRDTVPSPYYDGNDGLGLTKSATEWKKVERRIRKELPKYVQKKVEGRFDQVNVDILRGLSDIVRDGIHELLGPAGKSPAESPAGSPRHVPSSVVDCHPLGNAAEEQRYTTTAAAAAAAAVDEGETLALMDLSPYLGGSDQFSGFDFIGAGFDDQFNFGDTSDCWAALDAGSDSGYASGSTGRGATLV